MFSLTIFPQNFIKDVLSWIFPHGVRVIAIVAGAFVLNYALKIFLSRFLENFVKRGFKIGNIDNTQLEEKRLETLERVSCSIVKTLIWLIAIITILPEFGIDITPLLAGIGVSGLALGLGARSLIQDYLSGLFILLEDQYRVGEEVEIAGIRGKVKDFSLRRTVLEDSEMTLHYIPNSQVKKASNFSRQG